MCPAGHARAMLKASNLFAVAFIASVVVSCAPTESPAPLIDIRNPVWLAANAQQFASCGGVYRAAAAANRRAGHEDTATELDKSSERVVVLARLLLLTRSQVENHERDEDGDKRLVEDIAQFSERAFAAQSAQGPESDAADSGRALDDCLRSEGMQTLLLGAYAKRAERDGAAATIPL